MPSYRCTVNEVGPAVDGTETASPVVYINLTDIKGSFANTWFYAADGAQNQMLDVAIAAINHDNAVDVVATAPNAGGSPYTEIARIHERQTLPLRRPPTCTSLKYSPRLPRANDSYSLAGTITRTTKMGSCWCFNSSRTARPASIPSVKI